MQADLQGAILGCLLGTAVGDALGLPAEGMSRKCIAARWPELRHRLVFGRGMFSDDTEHTLMIAETLQRERGDAVEFARVFAWKLRWWLLALPAGVGLSTAKAIVRLWLGFPASRSGVRSAGNGAAMRSTIVGVIFRDDPVKRREFTLAACRVTHTDPRAEESALLVAEAAALASLGAETRECLSVLGALVESEEMKSRFAVLRRDFGDEKSVLGYAADIGCGDGVSGFAPNTVAVALYAWLRHRNDYETALRQVIACGGDTDTVAAITGGICGAEAGEEGIPKAWIDGICDWPRSVGYVRGVASELTVREAGLGQRAVPAPYPLPARSLHFAIGVLLRNVAFLLIVLAHGFRRLLPPY